MKIILLENAEGPRIETILNDNPAGELDDLLGGPVEFTPLTHNLQLVTRRCGEALNLPIRYRWDNGHVVRPIYGNCAVVRSLDCGSLCNISSRLDLDTVSRFIQPVR